MWKLKQKLITKSFDLQFNVHHLMFDLFFVSKDCNKLKDFIYFIYTKVSFSCKKLKKISCIFDLLCITTTSTFESDSCSADQIAPSEDFVNCKNDRETGFENQKQLKL